MILKHTVDRVPYEMIDLSQYTLIKHLSNPLLIGFTIMFDLTALPSLLEKNLVTSLGFFTSLVILMALDLITGVTKVWVTQGLEYVTSRGLRDTVSKCIQYGSFLIITHIITHIKIEDQFLHSNLQWLGRIALEFLIGIEIKSIYENLVRINPRLDVISSVGKGIVQFCKKHIIK